MSREIDLRLKVLEAQQRPSFCGVLTLAPGEDAEKALHRHGIDPEQPGRLAALLPLKRETTT
jgi:hypothetical protein